jgi:von Willebrand factor type A domain
MTSAVLSDRSGAQLVRADVAMAFTRSISRALRAAAAAALVAAIVPLGAQQRERREQHVYVGVTSSEDAPITDLKPADFVVREDGVAREVLRAAPGLPPTHVALLVDDSEVAQQAVADLRTALSSFVKKMFTGAEGLHMSYTTFGERPTKQVDYTNSPATLEKAIGRLFHRTGSGSYFMEAVQEAARDLRKREAQRPVIIAFVVERGPEFSSAINKSVAEALKTVNASLWTVVLQEGAQNLGTPELRERAIVIGDVTRDSGGDNKTVLGRQALESAFLSRAAILNSRYDVVYGRPDSLIPPSKIEVEVKRKDVRVLAPRWTGK